MIIFELGCTRSHRFEGWFASSDDFARQSESGMVRCPMCDDAEIAIVPSARVRVSKGVVESVDDAPETSETQSEAQVPVQPGPINLPAELVQQLRDHIRNTENVGNRFPEEARKIHYEEAPARAIRGQASAEEAQALRDEGIEF